MTELRKRMIQDMRLAGLVEGTQHQYLRAVRQLAAYYMISPDQLSERHVEKYFLYIRTKIVSTKIVSVLFSGAHIELTLFLDSISTTRI